MFIGNCFNKPVPRSSLNKSQTEYPFLGRSEIDKIFNKQVPKYHVEYPTSLKQSTLAEVVPVLLQGAGIAAVNTTHPVRQPHRIKSCIATMLAFSHQNTLISCINRSQLSPLNAWVSNRRDVRVLNIILN